MESSISLEETNKIRISLGLKPLVDDGAPVDVKQKAAEDNYAETREREKAAKRTRYAPLAFIGTPSLMHVLPTDYLSVYAYILAKLWLESKSKYMPIITPSISERHEPIYICSRSSSRPYSHKF